MAAANVGARFEFDVEADDSEDDEQREVCTALLVDNLY